MSARVLIEQLGLEPHFEGGWFRELYRSATGVEASQGRRTALTTILYLLEEDQRSRWHVVAADEAWHFHAGAGLELLAYDPGNGRLTRHVLGTPAPGGAGPRAARTFGPGHGVARDTGSADTLPVPTPVAVVPAGHWQAARPLGEFALVGCTVGPGFELMDFRFVADLAHHRRHFTGELAAYRDLL